MTWPSRRLAIGALFATAGLLAAAASSTAAQTAAVSGYVTADSTRTPLAGADVSIAQSPQRATTNATGEFKIAGLAPGVYVLTVRAVGYAPALDTFELSAGLELIRRYQLKRTTGAINLDSVKFTGQAAALSLSPSMREFERRRAAGFGHFVVPDDMRKNENRQLAEVLVQRVPGLKVISYNGNRYVAMGRGGSQGAMTRLNPNDRKSPVDCWPQIYLGTSRVWYPGTGEPVPSIDSFQVHDLGALEFYAGSGSMPPEFNTPASGCGTLVLQQREK